MKANISIEVYQEDITEGLNEAIKEAVRDQLCQTIKETAQVIVKKKMIEMIDPIMDNYFKTGDVNVYESGNWSSERKVNVEKTIKSELVKYLDQPVYLYSRTANTIGERYHISSSRGGNPSRMQMMIDYCIQQYVDSVLLDKINQMINAYAEDKLKIQEAMKEKLTELIAQKIK